MVFAFAVTGLDFHAFRPLVESLIDSGDLSPDSKAIAFPNDDPTAKTIFVVSTLPILKDSEDVKTLNEGSFLEACRLVASGAYATWGNAELFGGDAVGQPDAG